ncbi:amiloride-sensitive sodium channel domain-containing protein [Phthorimaea operculella]|nr:amiloride-sensitive sodium channel domain-containing protein [Phthorimaea operculella]
MEISQKAKRRKRPKAKIPENLSMEMILRKSFLDSFKEYVECCSLAGVKQMCDPTLSIVTRILWAISFCGAIATICYFLQYIWSDTLNRPLIVTMESTTYPISLINFPAVAICSNNRISKKALTKFAMEEYLDLADEESSLEDVEKVILNWGRLINFSFNASLNSNRMYQKMAQKYRNDNRRIEQVMRTLAPTCEDILVKCAWAGVIVDCMSIFHMHRIANRGHCCTFNYWLRKLDKEVKKQSEPGELHGLTFLLDTKLEDYAYPLYAIEGFDTPTPGV